MTETDGVVASTSRWLVRAVLAVSLTVAVAALALPTWYRLQGDRLLVVTSGSMQPTFDPGDAIVLRQAQEDELRPLMVVTYRPIEGGELVTHRIQSLHTVDENGPIAYMRTKGDNNDSYDADLTPVGNIVGVVDGEPPLCGQTPISCGEFLLWAQTALGRLVIFGPPLAALILAELAVLRRHRREREIANQDRRRTSESPEEVLPDAAPAPVPA